MHCTCRFIITYHLLTEAEVWDFPVMTSLSVNKLFIIWCFWRWKKPKAFSIIHLRAQEVIRGHVHWTEKTLAVRSKPELRDSRNSFFENETIFVFITPRSWANLALKIFFHNARSLRMGYWPSVRSRWLDIGQVLFLRGYGPRRSRGP